MSGGPPHHPHNRQVPGTNLANTTWNHHLQIPNYFPRQPQLAHMSNEHSLLHQPTWHTPTTESLKIHPPPHILGEMFKNESLFPRDCVDLSLARNGNQNGEVHPVPISLSVRDTNKINSLPPSALEIQAVELTKSTSPIGKPTSPAIRPSSPGRKSLSPGLKSSSPGLHMHHPKSNSPVLLTGNSTTSSIFSPGSSLLTTTRPLGPNTGLKSVSPVPSPIYKPHGIPGLPASTTVDIVKSQQKRSNIRVDSILERLNPQVITEKIFPVHEEKVVKHVEEKISRSVEDKPVKHIEEKVVTSNDEKVEPVAHTGVIVPPMSTFDDNSNSSSILNAPNFKDDDTVSTNSNEDSLDSTKSRRKRKPSKTIRVSKDDEKIEEPAPVVEKVEVFVKGKESDREPDREPEKVAEREPEKDPISIMGEMLEDTKNSDKEESPSSELDELIPAKTRRKTSSESETIDDIAAMVQEGLKEKEQKQQKSQDEPKVETETKPISVSVIKTKENLAEVLTGSSSSHVSAAPSLPITTPAAKKASTNFVEVENKLEEMFAGIEDTADPIQNDDSDFDDSKTEDPLLKLDDSTTQANEGKEKKVVPKKEEPALALEESLQNDDELPKVALNAGDVNSSTEDKKPISKKTKRKAPSTPLNSAESTPKKKKVSRPLKPKALPKDLKKVQKGKPLGKVEAVKDVYAYDSGSNTSSTKSKGPFVQIKGPRDSPLSVSVINSSLNEEDGERRLPKTKKFHDDSEYRHKVRSKGLHSSTLSNKYDAQTKDATWICAFCKRGPHASELTGPTYDRNVIPPGDLFGPYFITTRCPEFERRLDDPYDRQFKSRKITKALDAEHVSTATIKGKKSKRKHSDSDGFAEIDLDIYLGITDTGNKTYEIWAHEDCIVWSQGTYLIGSKIVGLEEAVWTCCNVTCKSCHLKGANVSCFRRGCLNAMHVCCARSHNWQFLESNFKAYCPEHQVP